MRILHLVHQYPPEKLGGTEQYTQALARCQAGRSHVVAVFCPAADERFDRPLEPAIEDDVRVYRIPIGSRTPWQVFSSTFTQRSLSQAFQVVLDQFRPDLVHVQHLMGLPLDLIEHVGARHIPFVLSLHDYWYRCANAQLLTNYDETICDGPRAWINCGQCALARAGHVHWPIAAMPLAPLFAYRGRRLRRVWACAAQIISPTDFVRDQYQRLGLPVERVQVIPHGIELPADLPTDHHSADGQLRVAYLGSLARQKGVHVLIEAVNSLSDRALQLSIFGDASVFSDYVLELQQLVRHPGIQWGGKLSRAAVWSALLDIDVLVVPSLWYEASPLVVQEAFAARVPVVASDIGGLREKTLAGGGLVFPPGDVTALQHILRNFLDHPTDLERLRAAIKPVRTITQHVAELEMVYQRVIVNGSRKRLRHE
jgi:glycosyltransferase involved in cell wall biosynthesis